VRPLEQDGVADGSGVDDVLYVEVLGIITPHEPKLDHFFAQLDLQPGQPARQVEIVDVKIPVRPAARRYELFRGGPGVVGGNADAVEGPQPPEVTASSRSVVASTR
jgi:hypothetical protein